MKDLDIIAINLFNEYSNAKIGMNSNWNYLGEERKIEWLKEIVFLIGQITANLKDKLKLPPNPSKNETSYGLGFLNGITTERIKVLQMLEYYDTELKKQLELIINPPQY